MNQVRNIQTIARTHRVDDPESNGKNLVFLISQPRAGSTMLQKVLGGHSKIGTTSEPWIMLHPIFALKQQQLDAPFEPHLAEIALEDFVSHFPEKMELFFDAVRRYAQTFYRRSLEKSQKSIFLDKTPRYYMIIPELVRCFPEAKFVVLMRNPMAVLSSMLITWFKNNPQNLLKSRSYNDMVNAPKMLLDGLSHLGKNGYVVHYENVVHQTEKELTQLCRFLDIDFEPGMLHYGEKNIANGRLGDQIGVISHDHPVINSIDKWIWNLKERNLKQFAVKVLQSIGHDVIINMGYDVADILNTLHTGPSVSGNQQDKSTTKRNEKSSTRGKSGQSALIQTKKEGSPCKVTNRLVRLRPNNIKKSLMGRPEAVKKQSGCRVTVILPTNSEGDGLKRTLESIPDAMQDISYEILLCADKQREEHGDYINSYPIKKVFYDEDVFEKEEKFSWSKLMNHGFAQAAGEWIMYGSDDIVFYPGCFKMACELLGRINDENIGGVTFFHRNTAETYDGFFQDFGYDTLNGDKPYINFGMIKADAYRKTDGFDEKLRFFWADVDICVQTLRCGYKIIPSPGSLVEHHNLLEKEKKDQRIALFEKDMACFHSKWRDDKLFGRSNPLEKVRYYLSKEDSRDIVENIREKYIHKSEPIKAKKPHIVIDGVIFQLQAGKEQGISRVWRNLIPELMRQISNPHITVLQRGGYPVPIKGVNIRKIPAYRLDGQMQMDEDDEMLRQTCRDLKADLFLTTYFTRAPGVINVVMIHDLIPEKLQFDLSRPEWVSKKRAVETADAFICVSHSTRNDLRSVFPQIANRPMIVAPNGIDPCFKKPTRDEVSRIRCKFNLHKPYVMLVGNRYGYKNGIKMLAALSEIQDMEKPSVLCVGGEAPLSDVERRLKEKLDIIFAGQLNDQDLVAAYGGALALMVPSQYEGFGLPVIEAMACGCPVIANRSHAVSEVGGNAVYYADLCSKTEISKSLKAIKRKSQKEILVQNGRDRAKKFNWPRTSLNIRGFIDDLVNKPSILLTAVVSTYNAADFICGCLEDLESQTIANLLEIIVVDSASEQNEAGVVRAFQKQYANIKYIRTQRRETVYQAWNRGIKFALGKYVSNANTDDRHRQDAFEQMVQVLEEDETIALVYADVIKTRTANETFRRCTPTGMYHWYDWDRSVLLEKGCFIGPQPVWRKSIHQEYGYFDEDYEISADFEFWLRISQTKEFYHINKPLGLYMDRSDSIEHANGLKKQQEDHEIFERYRRAAREKKRIGVSSESNANLKLDPDHPRQQWLKTSTESTNDKQSANKATMQGGHHMNSPETIIKAIQHLVDGGQKESALWAMDKLLADFPDNARLHNEMATLAYEQADTKKALAHFQKAVALDPQNTLFLKSLADYYYVIEKDAENALAQYEAVLGVDPKNIDSLVMAGHLSTSLHRYSQGQQYYERALDLDPQNTEIRQILDKMNHPATDQPTQAVSSDALYAAAGEKVKEGDGETAISLLEQLLARDDQHALAHNDLGVLQYESGNMQAALNHYERAAGLQPENDIFQKNLADFYLAVMGDHGRALRVYIQVLKLDPRDVDAVLSCGQICMSLGQKDDARDFIKTAIGIEPWNENARNMLSQLDLPVASSEVNTRDLYEQAKAKANEGDLHGAINDLNNYVAVAPENANAHNDLGVLYFETGEKDKAVSAYERAVQLEPTDVTYRKNLADIYLMEQGRIQEAIKIYLGVLEENPQDIESLIACGVISASVGQSEDAELFYSRVIEIEPWNETARKALANIRTAPEADSNEALDAAAAG